MKIIITEEQYKQLTGTDDVFTELSPYFRRRANFIDIPKTIERNVSLFDSNWYKQMSMNYLQRLVINNVIWETVPSEWGGSEDSENLSVYNKIMFAKIMDKYGKFIEKILKEKLKK
jgi:hypothetical protein